MDSTPPYPDTMHALRIWLVALRREGVEITRKDFLKPGLVVMPTALVLSVVVMWVAG